MHDKDKVIEASQLLTLKELNEEGEPDLVHELIKLFLEQSPKTLEYLEQAVKEENSSDIEKAAHKLKGSCANLGGNKTRFLCEQMEELGSSNKLAESRVLLEAIRNALKELCEHLKKDWYGNN